MEATTLGKKPWRELTFREKKALYEEVLAEEVRTHKFANKTRVARSLKITRQALYDFLDQLEKEEDEEQGT